MIVIEFLIFVVSSGVFYSERFRGNLVAVLVAGAVATGSSLLFAFDLGKRWLGYGELPKVEVVQRTVKVVQKINQPPQPSGDQTCKDDYPFWSRLWGQEGTSALSFDVLADGTVANIAVAQSSGSERLDDAAVACVQRWHYRPGIKDGKLSDTPWKASVVWSLDAQAPNAQADVSAAGEPRSTP